MKVVLEDGFAIQKGTGVSQHTLNLFHYLREVSEIDSAELVEKPFLSKVPSGALRRVLYITWLNTSFQLFLKEKKPDIVHFTNYLIPIVRLCDVKYLATIHDLTAWRLPETVASVYLSYIKWAVSQAVKRADLVLTVSEAVKREIIKLFGVHPGKIRTVYNLIGKNFWKLPKTAPDKIEAIKAKFGIKGDFLLFIGTIEQRKNLMTLIRAFEKVRDYRKLQLVLVGKPGYGFSKVDRYLSDHRLKGEVILTGYVSEEEKIALYDSATTFVYPSLYEGFGIPLVEAMVRKVPIVASRIPSTEEVAGEAALYYSGDPLNHETLAESILMLLENENLQQNLVKEGLKRAQEFSWEKVGKRYLQAYQEALDMDKL